MNCDEAKEILSAYRPGTADERDPLICEALALAQRDPELQAWLDDALAFDRLMRASLSEVKAPVGLKERILAEQKIIRPSPWWNPRLSGRQFAAAAAILVAIGLAIFWTHRPQPTFAEFRREIAEQSWGSTPHVDAPVANWSEVLQFLSANGVSTNFSMPTVLTRSTVRGCSLVHYHGRKVPVICFSSEGKHVHIAVAERALFPDAPSEQPQTERWDTVRTASWSRDAHTYVLSGLSTHTFVKKFRKDKRWDFGG